MDWVCSGVIVPAEHYPSFGVPIFSRGNEGDVFAQKIGENGLVSEMRYVSYEYLHAMHVITSEEDVSISLGDPGVYAFFLSRERGVVGIRYLVESFISRNMDAIEEHPAAQLSAKRFIGCSVAEEVIAIERAGNSISNERVRGAFVAYERFALEATEEERTIDDLIMELQGSNNFAETHSVVAKLMGLRAHFQRRHYRQAMRATLENNQVYWISGDSDVKEFVNFLMDRGDLRLSDSALSKLSG